MKVFVVLRRNGKHLCKDFVDVVSSIEEATSIVLGLESTAVIQPSIRPLWTYFMVRGLSEFLVVEKDLIASGS